LKKRIYLLGPMSGLPNHNFPAFHAAAKALRLLGFEVVNPAELDETSGTLPTRQDYYARDLLYVPGCDMGVALPGWEHSEGARLEAAVFHALNRQVVSYPSLLPISFLPIIEFPKYPQAA
jgi:hypothetical protein